MAENKINKDENNKLILADRHGFPATKITNLPSSVGMGLFTPAALAQLIAFHSLLLSDLLYFSGYTDGFVLLAVIPVAVYTNADIQAFEPKGKKQIMNENRGKSGIYRWTNKENGKCYIGSSVNLAKRFQEYFTTKRLEQVVLGGESILCNTLLKNGHSKFTSEIFEDCSPSELIKKEQHYFDLLKPDFHIPDMKTEGNGKYIITAKSSSHIISMYAQTKTYNGKNLKQNTDLETGNFVEYPSTIQAAKTPNISKTTVRNYIKSQLSFQGKFRFSYISRSMSTLCAQKITKIPVKNLANNKQVSISKHFPVATSEWHNSVYTYNPKSTISLLVIDQMIIKIITSYLNSFYLEDQNKNHFPLAFAPQAAGQGVREKIHSLYMNKVYVAQPELKHTNSKVIITLYVYASRGKTFD